MNILPLIEKSINHRSEGGFFTGMLMKLRRTQSVFRDMCLIPSAAGLEDFISDNNNYNGILGVVVASPVFMSILT